MDKTHSRTPCRYQAHGFPPIGAQLVQFWNGVPELCEICNGVLPVLHLCSPPVIDPAEEQDAGNQGDNLMLVPRAGPYQDQRTPAP